MQDGLMQDQGKKKRVFEEFQDSDLSDDQNNKIQQLLTNDPNNTKGGETDQFGNKQGPGGEDNETMDPEKLAREEYMRKLMSFRRDELVLNEESDGDDDADSVDSERNNQKAVKDKNLQGVEDAYELVEKIEGKMVMIGNVIRGMDKRMSYNLRLMGSIIMPTPEQSQQLEQDMKNAED